MLLEIKWKIPNNIAPNYLEIPVRLWMIRDTHVGHVACAISERRNQFPCNIIALIDSKRNFQKNETKFSFFWQMNKILVALTFYCKLFVKQSAKDSSDRRELWNVTVTAQQQWSYSFEVPNIGKTALYFKALGPPQLYFTTTLNPNLIGFYYLKSSITIPSLIFTES